MSNRLSRTTKILYGSGDIGFSLTSTIIGAYLAIFLTDVVEVNPALVAVAIFIGRSWDYINDPLVGYLSDRTRTRWGRRRPFLLFGFAPFAAAFAMLWWRPPWQADWALALYYAAAYVVFDMAATFVYMPYFALTPELTADYDERTSLTTYRMFFSILGSLLAFTLPLLIIGELQPENVAKVWVMGGVFGVASALPLLIVFFSTREKPVFVEQDRPKLLDSLRAAFRTPPFVYGLGMFLLTWVVIEIVQAVLLYYIKYWLLRESQSDLFMAVIFVTAIFALPLWNWASERWDKRWAYAAGIGFWAVIQIVLVLVTSATPASIILVLCVLAGIGVAAAHVLPWAIIPDAIEWDEWRTGERHEGIFYSLTTLAHKMATSFSIPLVLLLLSFTGYEANAPQQPASALWGLRFVMGPLPAILLCAGIALAFKYPLSRARYERIVKRLQKRRARQKEKVPDGD